MTRSHPLLWLSRHPVARDIGITVVVGAIATGSFLTHNHDPDIRGPLWWGVPLLILAVVPLAWRRRAPLTVLGAVTVGQMALDLANFGSPNWILVGIALATVGISTPTRLRHLALIVFVGVAGLFTAAAVVVDDGWAHPTPARFVFLPFAFLIGESVRRRHDVSAVIVERAGRAEREQELLAQQRVSEERTRIARELHDVVAHSVTVMIIQAGAARRQLAQDPSKTVAALEAIEESGRQAMTELRQILGVLRSDDDHGDHGDHGDRTVVLEPQATLSDLEDLTRSDPTLPISLFVNGDMDDVPASTQLAAYRLVQEALTNIRKHAGTVTSVNVLADRHNGSLDISVTDNGRGAAADVTEQGFGLQGMRERVGLATGSFKAGPRVGGGWRVSASFAIPEPLSR